MRSCYVSSPFGVKPAINGGTLDFDYLYRTVIRPAVLELQIDCRRLDEFSPGAIWQKVMLTALISSDLMIADISTQSANVFYELGVRHAMSRGRTLLISAGGPLPWNISYAQALRYQPDESGRLTGEAAVAFREALQATIRQSQHTTISDSPIYEFFPDLQVIVPPELASDYRPRRAPAAKRRRGFADSVVESPSRAMSDVLESEEEVRRAPDADPVEYLNLLRKYRDLSEWDHVIALANDAPTAVVASPEVRQLLALALNRRGKTGDQERAITVMERLIVETGGDSETFGILGSIYKVRYQRAKQLGDFATASTSLERALSCYQQGFDKNPDDYYTGLNVVTLLLAWGGDAAQSRAETVVAHLRTVLQGRREAGSLDFWELTTDLQLAAMVRDWQGAEEVARLAAAQKQPVWMIESILRELRMVQEKLTDSADRIRLQEVLDILRRTDAPAEIPG